MKKLAAALALSFGLASLASAASLDFSYDFDGHELTGTLQGHLEADWNTFDVTGISTLSWNGGTWTDLTLSQIHSSLDFPDHGQTPTVSVDGRAGGMNIFVCTDSFGAEDGSNCYFTMVGGFFLDANGAGASNGLGDTYFADAYSASNWQATLSGVPEAPAWLMLALGAIAVRAGVRRRRQPA